MEVDFKALKKIVDDTILTEGRCVELIRSILSQENVALKNANVEKIIAILGKWVDTPPVEILKELEMLASQKT